MGKKKYAISRKFIEKVARILGIKDIKERLKELVLLLRTYDSLKIRAEACSDFLRDKLKERMWKLRLKQVVAGRSMAQLVSDWALRSEKEGKLAYQRVEAEYGKETAERWFKIEEVMSIQYSFTEEAKKEIKGKGLVEEVMELTGYPALRLRFTHLTKKAQLGKGGKKG